ncbi:unnamed protein product [Acanthoscelides obtectus]|uniref:Uncharacterized protein n=1 Tax=Acanthoscelides obtectus TaxID=200917 RepID=A0A9P0K8P7_ACAOB|nr:unnamed protein product [Acanthoscelides obtectus]CAK1652068.1 hypothetical protein AOBTE_LOCUS17656 [Acanthoscelides obtectus]
MCIPCRKSHIICRYLESIGLFLQGIQYTIPCLSYYIYSYHSKVNWLFQDKIAPYYFQFNKELQNCSFKRAYNLTSTTKISNTRQNSNLSHFK